MHSRGCSSKRQLRLSVCSDKWDPRHQFYSPGDLNIDVATRVGKLLSGNQLIQTHVRRTNKYIIDEIQFVPRKEHHR